MKLFRVRFDRGQVAVVSWSEARDYGRIAEKAKEQIRKNSSEAGILAGYEIQELKG